MPVADSMRFKLEGFDEIERELKKLGSDAPKVLRAGMRAGAVTVKKHAQRNLLSHRQTGRLSDGLSVSTRIDRRRRSVTAKVKTSKGTTFYGRFLEFGTSRQSPTRWLTRALRQSKTEAFDAARDRMRARIRKISAKK